LKTNYRFLIIFGTNIPDTTCHRMTVQFQIPTSYCCFIQYEKKLLNGITHYTADGPNGISLISV